jgi:soluble lytic murein transglycosylase
VARYRFWILALLGLVLFFVVAWWGVGQLLRPPLAGDLATLELAPVAGPDDLAGEAAPGAENATLSATGVAPVLPVPLHAVQDEGEGGTTDATAAQLLVAAPPAEQMDAAVYQHRIGDYVAARTQLVLLLSHADASSDLLLQARQLLVRVYLGESDYSNALDVLDELDASLVVAPSSPQADMLRREGTYLRAVALAGAGRADEAVAAYQVALAESPWLAIVIQPRLAQTYLAAGNRAAAAQAYRAAAAGTQDTVYRARLLEQAAETYKAMGDYRAAAAAYGEILDVAQNAQYRAQIQLAAGQALAAAGDEAAAIARWRAATDEAPAARAAYLALVELVNRQQPFDLYDRGFINLMSDSFLPAVNAFSGYLEGAAPTDERAPLALLGLGRALIGLGNYASATDALNRVIAGYPECACFGEAWLDLARIQAAQGNGIAARRTYRTFARDHGSDPLAAEALWRSGMLALNEGNEVEGAFDLLTLADAFPASERAADALYRVGIGAFNNGLYGESINALARLQQGFPDYRWDAVGFWLGRAYVANGDSESAKLAWQRLVERGPDTYYGVVAALKIQDYPLTGGSMLRNVAAIAGPASTLPDDDGSQTFAENWLAQWLELEPAQLRRLPTAIQDDPEWIAGQMLLDLDERGDGVAALERVYTRYRDNPQALYSMGLAFKEMGAYRLSLLAMGRLLQRSPAQLIENGPIFIQTFIYPRHFADLIDTQARAHNLDPLLFFSLIRQESLFEEGARSHAAAQGLAQIIPATGAEVAQRLGYPNYTNDLIYRPIINIRFGAFYLDWARNYLDGNLVSALVGYNAGPGRSQGWRNTFGQDDVLFVERLPITEPRLYVQTITTGLYHYYRLYGELYTP